jgi:hypothetical protein
MPETPDSQLTFRCSSKLRAAFQSRCQTAGLTESDVVRLMMAGFVMGSVDVIATGQVAKPSHDAKQRTLPGIAPAPKKRRARK